MQIPGGKLLTGGFFVLYLLGSGFLMKKGWSEMSKEWPRDRKIALVAFIVITVVIGVVSKTDTSAGEWTRWFFGLMYR